MNNFLFGLNSTSKDLDSRIMDYIHSSSLIVAVIQIMGKNSGESVVKHVVVVLYYIILIIHDHVLTY